MSSRPGGLGRDLVWTKSLVEYEIYINATNLTRC